MYSGRVGGISFRADPELIRRAKERARQQGTTLNAAFRKWLAEYVQGGDRAREYRELMKRLDYVRAGRKFTREEMNSRD
jgi:hypothetical protein